MDLTILILVLVLLQLVTIYDKRTADYDIPTVSLLWEIKGRDKNKQLRPSNILCAAALSRYNLNPPLVFLPLVGHSYP